MTFKPVSSTPPISLPKKSFWPKRETARHAETLRAAGLDAVSAGESGLSGAADDAVRQSATSSGRVLVTLDGDFANIIRFPPTNTSGVVRLRLSQPTEEKIGAALIWTLARVKSMDLKGRLVVADGAKIRVRGLLE